MGDTTSKPPVSGKSRLQRDPSEYLWGIGLPLLGLALYVAAHHMSPSSFILPGIILVAAIATGWKYRDWTLGGLVLIGIVLSFMYFGDGARALSNGTWYSALLAAPASSAACQNAVSADNAASVEGHQATIEGDVVLAHYAATSHGSPTFLNFHDPYQGYFTVVIWGENRSNFVPSPEGMYLNRHVCVSGTVQTYRGSPEIIVNSPSEIQVVH